MLGLISIEALAFIAYLVRDTFSGVLRFYLDGSGLGFLWFSPDLLGFMCLALFVYRYIMVADSIVAKFVAAYIPFSLAIAFFFLGTVNGVFSAFKMITPLFVGFCFCQKHFSDYRATLRVVMVLFYCSVLGVILGSYVTFPWVGYSFESFGGVVREAGRLWWSQEEVRISGFSSENSVAAYLIMMTFVFTSIRKGVVWCVIWGLIALYAVDLTTSKTSLGGIALYLAALLLVRCFRPPNDAMVLKRLAVLSFVCILIPPILMVALSGADLAGLDALLYSMQDRINNSWQNPFLYMSELMPTGFVSGCGLGCFNYPQLAFSADKAPYYVPVDNFYIGTLLMFGPIFIVFVFLVIQSMRWNNDPYKLAIVFVMNIVAVTVLIYSPASSLMIMGIGFSEVFAPFRSRVGAATSPNPPGWTARTPGFGPDLQLVATHRRS